MLTIALSVLALVVEGSQGRNAARDEALRAGWACGKDVSTLIDEPDVRRFGVAMP